MNNTNGVQQPVGMQQPVANGMAPMPMVAPAKPVDKETIMKWSGVAAGAVLLIASFLPYVKISMYGVTNSANLWDSCPTFYGIVYVLASLIPMLTYFLQKGKHVSYFSVGYVLSLALSVETLDYVSIGYWLMVIAALVLLVLNVMDDIPTFKAMLPQQQQPMQVLPNMQVMPVNRQLFKMFRYVVIVVNQEKVQMINFAKVVDKSMNKKA